MQGIKSPLCRLTSVLLIISPFFFPLYLLKFEMAGIPLTVLEVFCYVLFLFYLIGLWRKDYKIDWKSPAKWYYYLAFILLLGAVLGTLTVPHEIILPGGQQVDPQRVAMGVLKGWVLAPMLYFFVLTQRIEKSVDLKKLGLSFVASGALVALVSYFFGIFGNGFATDARLTGFFESANYLSLYLVPAFLLSLYYGYDSKSSTSFQRWVNLVSIATIGHALLMTQSYAAILAVFGSIGLFILRLVILHRKTNKKLFWAFILLVVAFLGLMATQLNSPKFKQFLEWDIRSSTSVRLEIYQVSARLIQDHPLTGVGPGLFQSYYQTQAPLVFGRVPLEWNMPHPHNIFLAFWLNAGLLGFLALLGFLFLTHRQFTYPLLAFWGILIHGLFDTPFWKNDLAMVFWLVVGAIVILQRERHSS